MGKLSIGGLTLTHGLMLAPMAGVTDTVFRTICRRHGAEYTVSEMVSAKALCYEQRSRAGAPLRTAPLAIVAEGDAPMAVQLFGSDPDFMREAAVLIAEGRYRGATRVAIPSIKREKEKLLFMPSIRMVTRFRIVK